MVFDVFLWMQLLLAVNVAFTITLASDLQHSQVLALCPNDAAHMLSGGYLSTSWMLFQIATASVSPPFECLEGSFFASTVMGSYQLICVVLLLNMLIAIMSKV